mmetsp:Transcript_14481/g.61011  ORF Transcript_14481/g.61011 Transcript_14481/m.61011 type:complete len:276 (-) Transcript_14481:151-978(-)
MGMGVGEQVRKIELDAYQAFMKVTAVTGMSWERDELATKLRQELRISNDDHTRIREKLSEDERVKTMREGWRQREMAQAAKRARDEAGGGGGGAPAAKAAKTAKAKTPKAKTPAASQAKGPGGVPLVVNELICRRVQRFWPDEGGWFDAIVTDYRPVTNEHCLTYEINTPNETFEWANVSSFDAREFKLVEGDPVNIEDLKFYSQGIKPGAETASHNQTMRATHAAVGGIDTLVKKVAKSADASKVAEAKGTLSAQEEALKAQLAALADSDSDED